MKASGTHGSSPKAAMNRKQHNTTNKMKTTKHVDHYVKRLAGMASAALVLPVAAIENPAIEIAPKEHAESRQEVAQPPQPDQGEGKAKPTAWVGLGGSPVSEILSKHLGLEPGHGLTIFHVCTDSAAHKAGIKLHDVITEFDGKKIGTLQDLRDAVTARKPGEEVTIKFIHNGKAREKRITLGSRINMHRHQRPDEDNDPLWQGMGHLPKEERDRLEQEMKDFFKRGGGIGHENMQRLLEMRRERDKVALRLKKLMEDDNNGNIDDKIMESLRESLDNLDESMKRTEKLLGRDNGWNFHLQGPADKVDPDGPREAPGNKAMKFDFHAQASVTRMDEEGSVTIRTINGNKEVIVKDKTGKVLFEGPYQTEQDKAAVPEDFRHRIDAFNPDIRELGIREFGIQPAE